MKWTDSERNRIKSELAACFRGEPEVRRVVVFGSFLSSDEPNDLDVAVFQDGQEGYLALAMRYRRITRAVGREIPLDIIPMRMTGTGGAFIEEVGRGQVIYEQ